MNKLIAIVIFMFVVVMSFGQDISANEADSLLKSLPSRKADIDRIDILFKLAQYHIFKPGEYIAGNPAFACNKQLNLEYYQRTNMINVVLMLQPYKYGA